MGLVQTPFGFASTAVEVAEGIDLRGRRVVVTGASSGIGVETARALAGTGAEVTLAVRDVAAGDAAAATSPPVPAVSRRASPRWTWPTR
jgi:hypothetical protein